MADDANYATEAHPATRYVYIPERLPMFAMPSLARHIPLLFGYIGSQGSQPRGAPFFRYITILQNMEPSAAVEVEVGVPVPDDFDDTPRDEYRVGTLPAGKYFETVHTGAPETLRDATDALLQQAKKEGVEFDVEGKENQQAWKGRLEWYLTNPNEEHDRTKWKTKLSFMIKE